MAVIPHPLIQIDLSLDLHVALACKSKFFNIFLEQIRGFIKQDYHFLVLIY